MLAQTTLVRLYMAHAVITHEQQDFSDGGALDAVLDQLTDMLCNLQMSNYFKVCRPLLTFL